MKRRMQRSMQKILMIKAFCRSSIALFVKNTLGIHALSDYEIFRLEGADHLLYKGLPLDESKSALICGGYLGESASTIYTKYKCNILVIEPIQHYASQLTSRFITNPKITILEGSVSNIAGLVTLNDLGMATSEFRQGGTPIIVKSFRITDVLESMNIYPSLIELNIEGGEYKCFEDLIESDNLKKIQTILVQFHDLTTDSEFERAKIRRLLRSTHREVFSFLWVWERWDRI